MKDCELFNVCSTEIRVLVISISSIICVYLSISNKGTYYCIVNLPQKINLILLNIQVSDRPDLNKRESNVFILMGISRQAKHTGR